MNTDYLRFICKNFHSNIKKTSLLTGLFSTIHITNVFIHPTKSAAK